MIVDARRLLMVAGLALLAMGTPADDEPGRPTRLSIDPNAILKGNQPLRIDLEGIPRDQPARLWVLEDCDGDGRPDESPDCPRVWEGETEPARAGGVVSHQLDFAELKAEFPRGVTLWLRAARGDSQRFRQAMFGFVDDECSLFKTVVDAFLRGHCDPGLEQVLRRHRQPTDLTRTIFEVRRLAVDDPSAEPVAVPGTRGASGVAWLDATTLLVTSAGVTEDLSKGVYRLPLAPEATPERLWGPEDDAPRAVTAGSVAPLALSRKRIAFVRQASGSQHSGAGEDVAWLMVLRLKDRKVEREVPLPYKVHQLVAVSADGGSVLALSLGVADNQPIFMAVPVKGEAGEPEVVGFSSALYQSALREPGGQRSVVAFENAFAVRGWQLALAEGKDLVRDLVKRDGLHDLAPAWRPRGGELAYLAQVGGAR